MIYAVIFSDKALRQLKKLERKVQERINTALDRIRIRPHEHDNGSENLRTSGRRVCQAGLHNLNLSDIKELKRVLVEEEDTETIAIVMIPKAATRQEQVI